MSVVSIDIQRLHINLHGLSAQVVEQAMSGLEDELYRRLAGCSLGELAGLNLAELALPAISSEQTLDSAALRDLIAEGLANALLSAMPKRTGGG